MHRRNFIQTSATATTALLLSSLESLATDKPSFMQNKNFELKVLATNWGFAGTTDDFCKKAKAEDYDGIEIWWPMEKKGQDELFASLKKHNLAVGFLAGSWESDYQKHFDVFKRMIDAAATNPVQKPLYINCHSGKDYFSYEENKAFIDHTTALAKQTGLLICHETHRSRMLFAAPVARQYMQQNPSLKLTLDASHWCNVSESLLQDQPQTMEMAIDRTEHIHARIGHSQGPQVADPRAPEWEAALKAHLGWWDRVVARKKERGERLTILTEFGPPDYMPTTPYTRQPLADQWGINVHMMHLLRKRYLS
jgi:sugar phosphate isomerase/epimerase